MNKKEEVSVSLIDIKEAEEILSLKFGITIENKVQKGDTVKGILNGGSGFIKKAKSKGYIVNGVIVLKPATKSTIRRSCI